MTVAELALVNYEEPTPISGSASVAVDEPTSEVSDQRNLKLAGLPLSVSRRQLYYWSRAWQDEERAALEELADGDFVEFDSMADAIQWLCSPDD